MRKKFLGILFLSLCISGINGIRLADADFPPGETILSDNFDSYQLYDFPYSGGWQLIHSGAGGYDQYIDFTQFVSDYQSLHLMGSSCLSASAYHPVTFPDPFKVTLDVNVRLGQKVTSCGCGQAVAEISLFNPSPTNISSGLNGISYGGVSFNCDGYIYGGDTKGDDNGANNGGTVKLMNYMPNTWYNVRIDVDMTSDPARSSIYINGIKAYDYSIPIVPVDANGTPYPDTKPTGVMLSAGYAVNNPVWFDDVCVLGMLAPSLPLAPTPPSPANITPATFFGASGLLNLPNIQYAFLPVGLDLYLSANMQLVNTCNSPECCFNLDPNSLKGIYPPTSSTNTTANLNPYNGLLSIPVIQYYNLPNGSIVNYLSANMQLVNSCSPSECCFSLLNVATSNEGMN